jgi:hypothetical protein
MALSNWDTLAVDENGESTNGVFISKLGVSVEFYKNWLYVRDEKAWQDGGRFVSPTVMQIEEGTLSYKDVNIVARRGPQNGVYAVIQTTIYPPTITEDCSKCKVKAKAYRHEASCPDFVDTKYVVMVGCGVYGYSGEEWVGVTDDSKKFLIDWTQGSEKIEVPLPRLMFNKLFSDDQIRAALALKGQVVSRFTDENVFVESDSHHFEDHIRKLDLSKALRFNQGDAYFANKVGTDIPATPPGTAQEPWLTQALKKDA